MTRMERQEAWDELERILKRFYEPLGKPDGARFQHDIRYLERAYLTVERWWDVVFKNIKSVRFILLSESPLFWPKMSYFYNYASQVTSFFTYADTEALIGGPSESPQGIASGKNLYKVEMIKKLTAAGFLVLEIFPFALNPKKTLVGYPHLAKSVYRQLFNEIKQCYLLPKINRIKTKCQGKPGIAFRYARAYHALSDELRRFLALNDLWDAGETIPSIHKDYSLNRPLLARLFQSAQGTS